MIAREYFETRRVLLEEAMDVFLESETKKPTRLYKAMRYSVFSGGKRIRPIMFFACYEMLRGKNNVRSLKAVMPAAIALELVHTASIIHDDLPIMDNSDERRGKPSCHVKFDEATAILAGDALITKAFEALTQLKNKEKSLECISVLARAASTRGLIGGQAVDVISHKKKIKINELRYIHLKKTGALLQAAMELACILYGAEENQTITLGNFALNLGLAYQIIDDILDEVGVYDVLGKEPGSDLRSNKGTYTSLLGLDKAKKEAQKLLKDAYNMIKNMPKNDILVELINLVQERLP